MFKFELLEKEKVLAMYRQTEFSLAKTVAGIFVLIYLPWYFLIRYELDAQFRFWLLVWTLLILIFATNKYLLWLINVYVITDKRLINFHYKNLFSKTVLETPLERILNVSFKTSGLFSSLLNFGDVEVQAAGLKEPMVLKKVRQPAKIKDFLWHVHREASHS